MQPKCAVFVIAFGVEEYSACSRQAMWFIGEFARSALPFRSQENTSAKQASASRNVRKDRSRKLLTRFCYNEPTSFASPPSSGRNPP